MYFLYRLLSEGFDCAGVISFWVCITQLQFGDWNMLLGAIIMFVFFGMQALINRTECVKKLKNETEVK